MTPGLQPSIGLIGRWWYGAWRRWLGLRAQGRTGLFKDSLLKCKYSESYPSSNQLLVISLVRIRQLISRVLVGIVIMIPRNYWKYF